MSSSLFAGVEMAPHDPILGITEAYHADPNPNKVNLGVGVYVGDDGKVPVLECVRRAEQQLAESATPRNYLPIDGLKTYDRAVQEVLFGADSPALKEGRVVTVQALGGTGGLKIGADLLRRVNPGADIWISDPSWENHRALFEYAGYRVNLYPYYDAETHGVKFDAMMDVFESLPSGTVVLLHACCHNPTGVDLTEAQWERVIEVVGRRNLVPLPRPRLPGLRRRPRCRRGGRAAIQLRVPGGLRLELFLEVPFALWRAGRRTFHRHSGRERGQSRAEPGQARDSHQLLEPSYAWRRNRCSGPHHARLAHAMGTRARTDA